MNTNTSLPNPVREDGLVLDSIYIADRSDLPSYSHYYPEVTLNLALTEDLLTLIASIDICVRTSPPGRNSYCQTIIALCLQI